MPRQGDAGAVQAAHPPYLFRHGEEVLLYITRGARHGLLVFRVMDRTQIAMMVEYVESFVGARTCRTSTCSRIWEDPQAGFAGAVAAPSDSCSAPSTSRPAATPGYRCEAHRTSSGHRNTPLSPSRHRALSHLRSRRSQPRHRHPDQVAPWPARRSRRALAADEVHPSRECGGGAQSRSRAYGLLAGYPRHRPGHRPRLRPTGGRRGLTVY